MTYYIFYEVASLIVVINVEFYHCVRFYIKVYMVAMRVKKN